MTENTWKKVVLGNTWDFKAAGKGAEFVGIYLSKDEHVGENDSNVYNFEVKNGEIMGVWGSTILDVRFKNLKFGEEVKIVYLGLEQSEKRKGKTYHNFNVFHREPEFKKTEEVKPEDFNMPPEHGEYEGEINE
jgi:hypothetical protein